MWVLLLAFLATLAWASSASAAVTQKQAASRAIDALGADEGTAAVIVFGLPTPVKSGTKITQAGTAKPTTGSSAGLSANLRKAGVRSVRAPSVLTVRSRSYFFYEDRGPFQLYQHPGRVALVDVATGRVTLSRTITWPPLVKNRLPAFLKSAGAYRSSKYQVLNRPWTVPGATQQRVQPRNQFENDPFGPGRPLPSLANSKTIANRLAAERSCVLRVTDTLPSFWNAHQLNLTRSYMGTLFEQLERDNPAFIDDRYGARSGETLAASVDRLTAAGCKDVLLYIAGQGYTSGGEPVIHLGTSVRKGGLLAQQNISATDLRNLVSARSGITFKFKIDAPYAGGFIDKLRDLTNVLLIETASATGDEAFAFIPQVQNSSGQTVTSPNNPAGLLEFTNCELVGLKQFFDSATEIDKATQAQNEGVSFLVEMLARAQELCNGNGGFADDLGASPQLYAAKRGSGNGTNRPPKAEKQDVTVTEDTPKNITLVGSDPDGDPITFTITKNPDHGTLTGTGANRTYTPNANYTGPDDFSFKVEDNKGASNTAKVDITVTPGNDAPVVTTSAGNTAYTENGAAVAVDASLTVSDVDDTNLEGATVRIATNFQAGDDLIFVDQSGITGTYNSGTGVLTLTGSASKSDYQAALRSITYDGTSDTPTTPKTVEFKVNDGTSDSAAANKNIAVTAVNDNPVLTTTGSALAYAEDSGAQAIDPGLTATDPDSASLTGATVSITGNFDSGEDSLAFTNQNGISGNYNSGTGVLTLSGSSTVANYQTALRSVTYQNGSNNPSTATRTVSFQADDGGAVDNLSNVATRDISIAPSNDAPAVTTTAGNSAYSEGAAAVAVDGGLTVTDADDSNIEGAVVRIAANFESGDELVFVDQLGITHNYNSGTGVLTLTGTASKSDYQTALRSVGYRNTTDDNMTTPKTVEFKVNDGDVDSAPATKDIDITAVNDNPVLNTTGSALAYPEDSGPQAIDPGLTASDPDSANLTGATVSISSNHVQADDELAFTNQNGISGNYNDATGTLTLSGSASVADYQTALRSVTYSGTNSGTKTVSFQADDGGAVDNLSNVATRDINITPSNDAPVVTTTAGNTAYSEGAAAVAVDNGLTVTDADDTNIESAVVRISANFESGDTLTFADQNGITGNYTPGTGVLTLTGTASDSDYQTALRSITYSNTTDDNLTTPKTVEFKVNDGDVDSAPATKDIDITAVNDNPVLNTTGSALAYSEDSGAQAVDPGLTASDVDSANLVGATVSISSNHVQADDELAFVNQNGISGSYNDAAGTLTLSGSASVANYQTALRSVTYTNSSNNPSGSKTVSFQADDGGAVDNLSNVATRTINLSTANDAPVVTTTAGNSAYTEGAAAVAVDGGLTVSDEDDTNIESGVVRISANFESGDTLTFTNQNGISGNYTPGTGVLTLTGTSSVANYEAALRSITYENTTDDNLTSPKTVEFKVNDGDVDSAPATKDIDITAVNDNPVLTTTSGSASFSENGSPVAIDPGLTATDPDSANLVGATVSITSNFDSGEDNLAFADQNGITGTYNNGSGVLTLSGSSSVANYQAALRSVTYDNTADNPNTATRTLSFQADDGGAVDNLSNVATRDVNISPANDAPVVTTTALSNTAYSEGAAAVAVDNGLTVTDADDTNIESAVVRISANFESGDTLTFTNQNGISGNYTPGTGVLTLTGTSSVANYETALRSITYGNTTDDNLTSPKTVEFKVNDGDVDSAPATKDIDITAVNDNPVLTTTGSTLSYSEDSNAQAVDPGITASDVDSANLVGATVSISSNHVQAEDDLAFVNQNGISGNYSDATGTLTLTGSATVANYQAALRSVTYTNNSNNPSTATRTVSFQADDGGAVDNLSNVATRDISISPSNDPPVVDTSSGSTSFTEGGGAVTVDGAVTPSDIDDTNLESAVVRISTNFESGDTLAFTNQNGISGNYSSGTGVLTLTGTSSVANYETALRSITYDHTGNNPQGGKTVGFKVNDGDADSAEDFKTINIAGTNDGPAINTSASTLAYTEGDGAVPADPGLTLTDPENDNISGATVQITGNHVQAEDELAFVNQNGITGNYSDATGTLTLSGTTTVANYQTALRSVTYENSSNNPSTATRTVSFQATDAGTPNEASNVATRDISVAPANDAPVVTPSNGSTPYTEGGAAATIDNALTVTDADDTNIESGQVRISSGFQSGDTLSFTNQNGISGNYSSGTGVLTLTGTSSVANYETAIRSITFETTNDNPVGSKTIEFKVNDGDVDSNTPTKEITVTPSNDNPTLTTSGGNAAFVEDTSGPVAVDPNLTLTDPDSANMQGATVSITNNFDSAEDELQFTNQNGITGNYSSGTGVLTLSGTSSVANYQTALRSVQYNNTDTVAPSTATRTVSFQATDSSAGPSNTATRNVTVQSVNDAPVVDTTDTPLAWTEDDPPKEVDGPPDTTPGVTVTDQDDTNIEGGQVRISVGFQSGDDLQFINQNGISGVYTSGTGVLTLSGTSSVANYQTALRSIEFQHVGNSPNALKTVEFKVNDGDTDSNLATRDINVTQTNDAPVVTAGGTLAYTENDPATPVHNGVTVDDLENDNITGGKAVISNATYQAGQDFLNWTDNNLADNITLDNINTDQQQIWLTGIDTDANYQAALRAVTYQNGSQNPSTVNRTVTFSATDQPGLTGSDTRTISVTAVDDPPTAVNDAATVLEDAAATSIPVLTNDTDPDGGPKTITSFSDPANGAVAGTPAGPGPYTGLTYQPDPNYCNDPPGTTPDTFNYTLTQGGPNPTATVSMTVTCVNDAPVADNETFNGNDSAHGNTTMVGNDPDDGAPSPPADNPKTTISGDILAGDTDIDGPGPQVVLSAGVNNPGSNVAGADDGLTNDGGSVTVESDGDFIFQPAASTSCTDTSDFFDYRVGDSGSPQGIDKGRVTIAIAGCVWYVNNNHTASPDNLGTAQAPFNTLVQAESASGDNHTVFVFDGDNSSTGYNTGFAMNSGERLIGEHEGLVVDQDGGGVTFTPDTLQAASSGAHPTLTDPAADVVELDDGNELRGFNIDPQGGGGIAGGALDTGGGTIDDVNVDDNGTAGTDPGLELNGARGTFNITDFTYDNVTPSVSSAPAGIQIIGAVGPADTTVSFGAGDPGDPTKINKTGGPALSVLGTNMGTSTFEEITVGGSGTGGVEMTNTTGSTTFGDGTGTDLDLTTTSGSTAAFRVSSGGTISVPAAGTADVDATGGPAIDVTSTTGATLNFDEVDSTNSASDGINLGGLGTGTFNANASSAIGGAAGISFDLDDGSGAITFPGALNDGNGQAAEITGRDGGAVSLSGVIGDDNDAGGGILVSGNNNGTTTFSNGSKTIDTTTSAGNGNPLNNAVVFNGSDGHTLTLSGGGLNIVTGNAASGPGGNGLDATASGTLAVTGSGNTITTTTGRALRVTDTDIDDSDLTFQKISSNGAINGINVANTANANGRLFLTGSGGACTSAATCTGASIQNSTQTGVLMNSVPGGAELMRAAVTESADHGIQATSVAGGILLDRSAILSNGNATADNGLEWTNVHGVSAIRASDIIGSGVNNDGGWNARILNTSGTLHLTVNDTDFNLASTEDGLQVGTGALGTGTIRTNITGNRFDDNKGEAIQVLDGVSTSVTSDHTITGNTVDGKAGTSTDGGVTISTDGSSRADISSNTITFPSTSAIILNPLGSGTSTTADFTASNNTIGTNAVADSGSVDGDGIQVKSASDGLSKLAVNSNTIRNYDKNGMMLRASEANAVPDPTTHLTATGNQISQPDPTFSETGIQMTVGTSAAGDVLTACFDVGGAGAAANTFVGTLGPNAIANIWLSLRFPNSKMKAPGYSGTTFTDRKNYFLGRNPTFNVGPPGLEYTEDGSQNMQNNAGACLQPASPTLPTAPPALGA